MIFQDYLKFMDYYQAVFLLLPAIIMPNGTLIFDVQVLSVYFLDVLIFQLTELNVL